MGSVKKFKKISFDLSPDLYQNLIYKEKLLSSALGNVFLSLR